MDLSINTFYNIILVTNLLRISITQEIPIVINRETKEFKLECDLSENNTMFWLKNGKEFSYNISFMFFHLKQNSFNVSSELIISDPELERDEGIYTCNGIQYSVTFSYASVERTEETVHQNDGNIFYQIWIYLKDFWVSFLDFFAKIFNYFAKLSLKMKIIYSISLIVVFVLVVIIGVISSTYRRADLNYAKIKYMLDSDIENDDNISQKLQQQEDEEESDLDNDITDLSFISLLNK